MNHLCTFYIGGNKIGTIVSISRSGVSLDNVNTDIQSSVRFNPYDNVLILSDQGNGSRVDLQLVDSKVVDEPLRTISSNDYIIIHDDIVLIKDKVYRAFGKIPIQAQWKVIPKILSTHIVEYVSNGDIDDLFLREGYAQELKNAKYIIVPPDWNMLSASCTPYDLLIENKVDNTYISYSGRHIDIVDPIDIDGRYIYIRSMPILSGKCTYPPFTYNIDTLIYKYDILQDRLQQYGMIKVDSLCASMRSLAKRLKDVKNQYMACSIYDDVVAILDKARKMD